jgi:hypothetical protein
MSPEVKRSDSCAAGRMRRLRARRARQVVVLPIEVEKLSELGDDLFEAKRLPEWSTDDSKAIAEAISLLLKDWQAVTRNGRLVVPRGIADLEAEEVDDDVDEEEDG